MANNWQEILEKIDDYRWRIPKAAKLEGDGAASYSRSHSAGMRVPGIIYADEKLLRDIFHDKALEQVVNVAHLPGIVKASLAMPDIHWGFGFPIGGVAATDVENGGVVSPGGVGFDINCGVRMMRTNFQYSEIKDKIKGLVDVLFNDVPSGLGSKGDIRVSAKEEREILIKGAGWAVKKGYGVKEDLEVTEDNGAIQGADPDCVSDRAYERGKAQSGTLGSGNHFVEVQVIDEIYDEKIARDLGLFAGLVTVMIHSGSRGLGYQICDENAKLMVRCLEKYSISVPDRQLACAPVNSEEGRRYLAAMRCAANYAWNNRQCLMHLTRQAFERFFKLGWEKIGMDLIYDVAHNIAKLEKYKINGVEKVLCVHRKGATRALPPGHPDLPDKYREIGQPVIIPGDMGRNSYLLAGTQKAEETFYSTCHGAGRVKSRTAATKAFNARELVHSLEAKGIFVKASGYATIVEEAPLAYKDVNDVVNVVHNAGIAKKVCRMRPVGVVKG